MTDAGGDRSALIDRLRASLHEHYRIERELGRGGMATVFLAEDLKHHRPVALKVLNEEVAAAVGPGRFLREIEISARLTHPHLLPLHDSGEADGLLYYVMPFIEGDTLRERLRREKLLPLEDAIRITCDIADGLAFAHRHDIVHRDIKPENILLQANRAILADFGVARALTVSATESKTATGIIVGTAMYMSPEQALGDRTVDARSDIYSLACVLYEMLIGEPPFTGHSVQAIVARHASERVPSLRLIRATVPAEVEEVITRALAKMPADRFTTVEEFSSRLRAARLDGSDRRRVAGRRRATILAVGGLALAAGAALAARGILGRALREDDWVLVADFEGPPGDQQSANVIRDFATQALQESRFVRVVERRQLNEVMRHAGIPETTFVGARQARELALRSSVRGVLRGGVRRMDSSSYEIALHVVSAEDGASLASVLGTASELALPDTIQELVRRLRRELGERRSSITMNR